MWNQTKKVSYIIVYAILFLLIYKTHIRIFWVPVSNSTLKAIQNFTFYSKKIKINKSSGSRASRKSVNLDGNLGSLDWLRAALVLKNDIARHTLVSLKSITIGLD